jgi:hypothetical protein
MRRLRAGLVTPLPGGLGPPSVPTKGDCPSVGWTRRGRRAAKAARIGSSQKPPGSAPGSYGPGDRNRRQISPDCASLSGWSAERRPHPSKEDAARLKTGAPLGAPPPRSFEGHDQGPALAGRKSAYPGPQRIRAAKRWLFDNCIGEGRARHTLGVMRGLDPRIHDALPHVIDHRKAADAALSHGWPGQARP